MISDDIKKQMNKVNLEIQKLRRKYGFKEVRFTGTGEIEIKFDVINA